MVENGNLIEIRNLINSTWANTWPRSYSQYRDDYTSKLEHVYQTPIRMYHSKQAILDKINPRYLELFKITGLND